MWRRTAQMVAVIVSTCRVANGQAVVVAARTAWLPGKLNWQRAGDEVKHVPRRQQIAVDGKLLLRR